MDNTTITKDRSCSSGSAEIKTKVFNAFGRWFWSARTNRKSHLAQENSAISYDTEGEAFLAAETWAKAEVKRQIDDWQKVLEILNKTA